MIRGSVDADRLCTTDPRPVDLMTHRRARRICAGVAACQPSVVKHAGWVVVGEEA
jgi:hypothetical protein